MLLGHLGARHLQRPHCRDVWRSNRHWRRYDPRHAGNGHLYVRSYDHRRRHLGGHGHGSVLSDRSTSCWRERWRSVSDLFQLNDDK